MREHGTRACYVFGPDGGQDRSKACRCEPCCDANRAYARERDRAARRPDAELLSAFVDAAEVREHLLFLERSGVGLRTIAARAEVGRTALTKIRSGERTRCTRRVAGRVLAVGRFVAADHALIDAAPTWALLNDMIAHGIPRYRIAREIGPNPNAMALQIGRERVTVRSARAVRVVYDRLMARTIAAREEMRDRQRDYRARLATAAPEGVLAEGGTHAH